MFDPSKLNLNLDDSKNDTPSTPEEIQSEIKKVEHSLNKKPEAFPKIEPSKSAEESTNNTTIDPGEDILGEIGIKTTPNKQDKKIDGETWENGDESIDNDVEEKSGIIGDISDVINSNKSIEAVEKKIQANTKDSLIDINIASLGDILNTLINQDYDLFILEPRNDDVKVSFRKQKVEKDVKYIKYPVYSQILLKAKQNSGLNMGETQIAQEGKGKIQIKDRNYNILAKTVPSPFGEKLLFKIKETETKLAKKGEQKLLLESYFDSYESLL